MHLIVYNINNRKLSTPYSETAPVRCIKRINTTDTTWPNKKQRQIKFQTEEWLWMQISQNDKYILSMMPISLAMQ